MAAPKKEARVLKENPDGTKLCQGDYDVAIPSDHPRAGERVKGTYQYLQCQNDDTARKIAILRQWKIYNLVNDAEKSRARANETTKALATFRSTATPDAIKTRMVADALRLGMTRENAEAMVANAFSD